VQGITAMSHRVTSIDIGNTNTKIGVIDIDTLSCLYSCSFPSETCYRHISSCLKKVNARYTEPDGLTVKICSVIKPLQRRLASRISSIPYVKKVTVVRYHKNLPVTINYRNPKTLGADRIANCLYGAKKYPGQDIILISAGTAITIDFLSSSGVFCGGFILPGLHLQLQALAQGTAELPMVSRNCSQRSFPPKTTQAAIKTGICLEIAGGVSYIVKKLIGNYPGTKKTVACGGMWKNIGDIVDFDYVYVPELTRIGIGLFEE